jgi:hypothetical protein
MTMDRARQIEASGGEKAIDGLILDYLKRSNVTTEQPARLKQPWENTSRIEKRERIEESDRRNRER